MAEARLLRKKISKSERVNSLPMPAQLLYTWLIGHVDVEGRFSGNPRVVKNEVFPLKNYTVSQVDKWLDMMWESKDDMTGEGLIERYVDEASGNKYFDMPGFDGEQSSQGGKVWKTREAPSDIPPRPGTSNTRPGTPVTPEDTKKNTKRKTDDILDPVFGQMVIDYEGNIGMLSPMLAERLKIIQDEYPEGWFALTVAEAVANNKRNLKYIEAILKRWKADGINPLKEIPAKEKDEVGRIQEYTDD